MVGKYNGEALVTMEKIKGNVSVYTPNRVYKNSQYNIYWKINTKGYMHILKPCKCTLNGEILHYGINDFLLTKDNMLEEKSSYGNYETIEKLLEALEREVKQ